MMKMITQAQIEQILNTIYQTNISARDFDSCRRFFINLPGIPDKKDVDQAVAEVNDKAIGEKAQSKVKK